MTNQLDTIKKIIVNNKEYFITLIKLGVSQDKFNITGEWICAYVYLDNPIDSSDWSDWTYHEGNVYGVDTAHSHNWNMTLDKKRLDAIKQITELLEKEQSK